jgi:hypothetical protein
MPPTGARVNVRSGGFYTGYLSRRARLRGGYYGPRRLISPRHVAASGGFPAFVGEQ